MTEKDNLKDSKVTLEDLLRLKREEKPSPEFWDEWDRSLEQKRWQALREASPSLERKPLLASIFAQLKVAVPVAAAAALTFMVYVGSQAGLTQISDNSVPQAFAQGDFDAEPSFETQELIEIADSSDYVIDTLSVSENASPAGYTRVLETEMFRKDTSNGAIFVADSMSANSGSSSGASYNYF